MEWASRDLRKQKRALSSPFVIGAFIEMRRCLDLTRRADIEKLAASHYGLSGLFHGTGQEMPKNQPAYKGDANFSKRWLDHAVINHLRKTQGVRKIWYDTVRSPFPEGPQAYDGARFTKYQHIQICVINPECIVGFFRPAGDKQKTAYTPPVAETESISTARSIIAHAVMTVGQKDSDLGNKLAGTAPASNMEGNQTGSEKY
jgi:hypothetical protein